MRLRSRYRLAVVAMVCVALGAAPAAVAKPSSYNWAQRKSNNPPPRTVHAMAYDSARAEVVLFGGNGGPGAYELADTWVWNGTSWAQRFPATAPPARVNLSMAYDAARGQVVLFGGNVNTTGALLGDTWTWDGTTWTQRFPATSPPPTTNAALVYDGARAEVVLFGGFDSAGRSDATWTWDGTTWIPEAPAAKPPARTQHALAYDVNHGETVLFGGSGTALGNDPVYFADTWTWDGANWTQRFPPNSPIARIGHAMTLYAPTGEVVLFGGFDPPTSSNLGDTWIWNGATWTQLAPRKSPPPTGYHAMAHDGLRGRTVLFGGSTSSDFQADTWIFG